MSLEARLRELRESLTGDFVPAIEANQFVALMKKEHPSELGEWMEAHAVQFCTERLSKMLRTEREVASRRAGARAFSEATESDDAEALSVFATVHRIDVENTRRPVADMTGPDHLYVAETYAASGNRDLLLAECHRVVARKVRKRRTADVLTEAEYLNVFDLVLAPKPTLAVAA